MCSRESFCRFSWGEPGTKPEIEGYAGGRLSAESAAHEQSASEPGTRTKGYRI
jgi:hypothetical protein